MSVDRRDESEQCHCQCVTFRSRTLRKFHGMNVLGTAKVPRVRKFQGAKFLGLLAPQKRIFCGTKVPQERKFSLWTYRSQERKCRGTKSPDTYGRAGWLKLKYPTGQNAISRQLCEIFIPKFLGLYRRDPVTILKFKKKYFSFLQSYGCINILCHIFNSAWNSQQQLVIFIVKKH